MEADQVDAGDWPAITPNSPPANWQPRAADGSWAETLIERFTCHHRCGGPGAWPARWVGVP